MEGEGHQIIDEFEREVEEEPSLSQISIATTSLTHTNSSRFTDNSSPVPLPADQATLHPRTSDSALSRDTFPGRRVDEHHTNYILMYDMLTGIRISVSRCQAKAARLLVPEDYTEILHLAFDSSGNEFTPSSKYDFKFKDYSPWIFRSLREAFKIDAADYLVFHQLLILDVFNRKGALQGRESSQSGSENIRILKDLDWISNERRLKLGPVKSSILMNQLKSDCLFLTKVHVMDYSLLVGIHFLLKGNSAHIFDKSMSVVEQKEGEFFRMSVGSSPTVDLAESEERRICVFYSDMGGYRATYPDDSLADQVYYLGIIDILTPYGKRKKFEHILKSIRYDSDWISTVNPLDYARRFLNFVADYILQYPLSREHLNRALPTILPEPD